MKRIESRKLACAMIVVLMGAGCLSQVNKTQPIGEARALSDVVQLTSGFAKAGEAYFSPDMRWIVFQATPKGEENYQMYVARLRWDEQHFEYNKRDPNSMVLIFGFVGLGAVVRVSPEKSRNTCGYFSPDGRSLIFASTAGKEDPKEQSSGYQRQGGTYRWAFPAGMEIFRADGWEKAVSAEDAEKGIDLAKNPITNNQAYDAECAYSPDGKWIVFSSNRTKEEHGRDAHATQEGELFVMRSDGSDVVQLTHAAGYDGGPFFSPEGRRVVYRSDRKGNDLLQIFVADVAFDRAGKIVGLKNEKQLTDDGNVNWGPYWHPDGKHIIYATSAHGHQNYELYLMRDDGTHNTRITYREGFDGLPVFSPDGKWLMWSSKRTADGTTQVFVARFHFPEGS